jgi:hypothetical protein
MTWMRSLPNTQSVEPTSRRKGHGVVDQVYRIVLLILAVLACLWILNDLKIVHIT